jgi:hypothetical protein
LAEEVSKRSCAACGATTGVGAEPARDNRLRAPRERTGYEPSLPERIGYEPFERASERERERERDRRRRRACERGEIQQVTSPWIETTGYEPLECERERER